LASTAPRCAGQVSLLINQELSGGSDGSYPTANAPLFGPGADNERVGSAPPGVGELYLTLVGPDVASMHVGHVGAFKPVHVLGVLPGDRAIVFYRPPGSRGTVIPPGSGGNNLYGTQPPALFETAYDAAGREIPDTPYWASQARFQLPSRYWHAPAPPAAGRCAINSSLGGVSPRWGEVALAIAPDREVTGTAFLSCLNTWYRWRGSSFDVGVLLNAQSPGSAPGPLWNAATLPRSPGIVVIKPAQYEIRLRASGDPPLAKPLERVTLAPGGVARRAGSAWIEVRGGNSTAQAIRFLRALRLTRLDVSQTS